MQVRLLSGSSDHPAAHSFPTRRSSDLEQGRGRLGDLGDRLRIRFGHGHRRPRRALDLRLRLGDRKGTRLNSSHVAISYAVFCSKKTITTARRPVLQAYDTADVHIVAGV